MFDTSKDLSPVVVTDDEPLMDDAECERIVDKVRELSAHINALEAQRAKLIARIERNGKLAFFGAKSTAQWASYATGVSVATARRITQVGVAMESLPATAAALEKGEISIDQAHSIAAVARPENEATLATWARQSSPTQLSRICSSYKRMMGDAEEAEVRYKSYLRYHFESGNSFVIRGRMTGEEGGIMARALEAAWAEVDPAAEDRDVASLMALADSYLAGKTTGRSGGDAYHLNVHVDAELLADPDADAMLVTQDGARLSQATLERILCDCSITALLERNGETIDVGRKTRRISPAMRRALNHRDRGCTFPGCTRKAGVDAHHTDPWTPVPGGPPAGKTKLAKLASGCRFHHTLVHAGELSVEMIDGKPKWFDRLGRAIPDSLSSRATGPSGPERNAKRGLVIDETTCASEWDGSYVDYDSVWAVLAACSSDDDEDSVARAGPEP